MTKYERLKRWRKKKGWAYLAAQCKAYRRKFPERNMWRRLRQRARNKHLAFNLREGDIKIPRHCPVLGIKLKPTGGRRTDHSPTVDRINNRRGYVRGNIAIVSWRANRLKSDASINELCKLAAFYGDFQCR